MVKSLSPKEIPKTGVSYFKRKLAWMFLHKRLLVSEDNVLYCPRCNADMYRVEYKSVALDVCSNCRGIWLDEGEVDKLAKIERINLIGDKNGN